MVLTVLTNKMKSNEIEYFCPLFDNKFLWTSWCSRWANKLHIYVRMHFLLFIFRNQSLISSASNAAETIWNKVLWRVFAHLLSQKLTDTHCQNVHSDYLESIQERYMITSWITSKPDAGLLSFPLFALQKESEKYRIVYPIWVIAPGAQLRFLKHEATRCLVPQPGWDASPILMDCK